MKGIIKFISFFLAYICVNSFTRNHEVFFIIISFEELILCLNYVFEIYVLFFSDQGFPKN